MSYKRRLALSMMRLGLLDAYSLLRRQVLGQEAVILIYHRVGDSLEHSWSHTSISIEDFENQIRYLSSRCHVIPLDELSQYVQEKKPLPKRAVVITFDDGYKDNYLNAYPVLKRYNVPATVFLATCHIDTGNLLWDGRVKYAIMNTTLEAFELEELGTYPLHSPDEGKQAYFSIVLKLKEFQEEEKNLLIEKLVARLGVDIPGDLGKKAGLSWDEIREMSNNGITFGAHTITHPILTKLPLEEARKQIVGSKRRIEEEVGKVVTAFSYPNGEPADFNNDIKQILRQNGFACAVTVSPHPITPRTDLLEMGRISLGLNLASIKLFPDYTRTQML